MSPVKLAEVRKHLDDYLSKGWIRPSISPFWAPILFARKKDGTRICIDYRALNKQTRPNRYQLLRIVGLLDWLVSVHYFSCLDSYTGYH